MCRRWNAPILGMNVKLSASARAAETLPAAHAPLPTLLVVSESEQAHTSVSRVLARFEWLICSAYSRQEAAELLRGRDFGVVLCDCELSQGNWKSLLEDTHSAHQPPKLIVFCRYADVRLWAEVLNLGAWDLLMYPFETQELIRGTAVAWQSWERPVRERHSKPRRTNPLTKDVR